MKQINKILKTFNFDKEAQEQNEMILEIDEKLNYLLNHNNFLMMKLVNKGVLSDREVNELHTRSSKKSKN